ncbi:MAG: DUF559 domain-containing protein, partial [Spirulina sp. SIO3F2]|nr:DUF559 domain-containing protein [Spirulina sp. SIO3F2]
NPVGVSNRSLDFARVQRFSPQKCVRKILAVRGVYKTPTRLAQREGNEASHPLGERFGERAELEILTQGMLNKATLLDLIRHFTVFEKIKTVDPETEVVTLTTIKKIGAYHQYYTVNKAVESVLRACGVPFSNSSQEPSSNSSQREGDRSPEVSRPLGERFGEMGSNSLRAREDRIAYRGGLPITTLLEQARQLRKHQTPAEKIVWETVRAKRFYGLKFRRQHQIGTFIVDFYCHQYKLVIELDGSVHDQPEQQQRDQERSTYLKSLGHTVLRFSNRAIFEDLEGVLNVIAQHLDLPFSGSSPVPSPSPSQRANPVGVLKSHVY